MSSNHLRTTMKHNPYAPQRSDEQRFDPARVARQAAAALAVAVAGLGFGGCQQVGDYLNLRNSFLNPAEVGRFDKDNPYGPMKPVKVPILEQLSVADQTPNPFANATDPTPADLLPEHKEQLLGPGDVVQLEIFELVAPGTPWQRQTRVNDVGMIGVQSLGNVKVGGLTASQVEQIISQKLVEGKILPPPGPGQPGPQVNVLILNSSARLFSLLGAVSQPGTYEVPRADFRLLDALALARDVPSTGGLQGMDYAYIIRGVPFGSAPTETAIPTETTPAVPVPGGGNSSPSDLLKSIIQQGATTAPATDVAPATGPAGKVTTPGSINTAMVTGEGVVLAQADLDAAANLPMASTRPATTLPAMPVATTRAMTMPATTGPSAPLGPDDRWVYVDGKWVSMAATAPAAAAATTVPTASAPALVQQRVIRIPLNALRAGETKYNIVIRPGDIINVPPVEAGEFYMMGNISRPGVYTLTARKITLKMAVAAAGNLGPLAIPWKCEIIRRVAPDQEAILLVNLQAIFNGEQPDVYLKANDVVNVGTDAIQPFLAVMRNAYRASYGWGFVYDRNYYIQPTRP